MLNFHVKTSFMKPFLYILTFFICIACTKKEAYQAKPVVVVVPKPKVDTSKVEIPKPDTSKTDTMIAPVVAGKTYLALGDSHTIGESVSAEESYPYQLVKDLNKYNLQFNEPKIVAQTGWTTSALKYGISIMPLNRKYDVVTLLIGVNNQYRGLSPTEYRKEFVELLNMAIKYADGKKTHVFVLSIPDWGVTPFGREQNKAMQISMEIDAFNKINKEETLKMDIVYLDITTESRSALNDRSLIATDGLHPSARMYADWVLMLSPEIQKVFK